MIPNLKTFKIFVIIYIQNEKGNKNMGITCKPVGKMQSVMQKLQNELNKAQKENKESKKEKVDK